MILPEDRPESPSKQDPPVSAPATDAEHPPPAYPGHGASGSRVQAGPNETQPIVYVPVQVRRGEPAGQRFCKAFFVALLIYFLLAAVTSSIAGLGRSRHGWNRELIEDLDTARPTAKDGVALRCIKGPDAWPAGQEPMMTTFKLDRMSDVLYVFTRGKYLSGNVVITQDERIEDLDSVHVDVTPLHNTPDWLSAVSVCSLMRGPNERGIGIFSPTQWRSSKIPGLEFEVTIRLPRLPDEVLQVARLETNVPNFTQHIGDLNETVLFRDLELKSSNSHISSQSLNALVAQVITSNSHIVGQFQASESLGLRTTNGAINVTATLVHSNPEDMQGPVLKMKTSNAKIDSFVNLVSTLPPMYHGQGGDFTVEANTSNVRLSLDFPTAPVDSKLNLLARTSNAKAHVRLHPTYEGRFSLRTSNQVAFVDNRPITDPSGKNRSRSIALYNNKWAYAHGLAVWDGEYMGNVDVKTSNAPAELYLA
ncbi:uncharacterized protein PHACADRAFT_260108 [Phanerochaete carnosa HHB-10118-sp]|uniref:Uncharacterized protein n=1 Tax=Phanerochaete carnosa (strain HHB-10118-sp) TaxID=650164 RepID=K5VQ85_PHACS|nr:uncharacterized protein PHACADRAFT_260108 [Phanerochaete carnosa HHB-10118-sp]EKM53643.1 hypothetical protein PHACADRAFT_260108 [Phanerochaete carnosa HHB-10118-sp]